MIEYGAIKIISNNSVCIGWDAGDRSDADTSLFPLFQFYEHLLSIDLSSNIIEDIEDKSFAAQKSLIKEIYTNIDGQAMV